MTHFSHIVRKNEVIIWTYLRTGVRKGRRKRCERVHTRLPRQSANRIDYRCGMSMIESRK